MRGIHIHKHRLKPNPRQRVRRADVCPRRHDDRARNAGRFHGDLEPHGPVAHGDAVFRPQILGKALFKFLYKLPLISQPRII